MSRAQMNIYSDSYFTLRKNLLWLAMVVLAALLQSTWPDFLKVEGVLPDLTLVLVV